MDSDLVTVLWTVVPVVISVVVVFDFGLGPGSAVRVCEDGSWGTTVALLSLGLIGLLVIIIYNPKNLIFVAIKTLSKTVKRP